MNNKGDGNMAYIIQSAITKIENNKKKYEGKIFDSTSCGKFKVIQFNNCQNVEIEFIDTKFKTITSAGHIRSGLIKDPFFPYLYGRGYIGESHRQNTDDLTPFVFWKHMMDRCYKEGYSSKSYENVEVCKEWYNFTTFKKWFQKHYVESFELDKDILQKGVKNKIYSPDTCVFLPKEINCAITTHKNKYNLPNGISLSSNNKYDCKIHYKNTYINKRFDTLEEAIEFYNYNKSKIIESLIEKYKDKLENRAIVGLRNYYKVEETK